MDMCLGCKQTEVGIIPNDWEVTQIGNLDPFVTSGSRGWAAFYSDLGSLFVRITNLSRDSIYLALEDSKFVDLPPGVSEGVRTQLREHDVLISITADIGIIGYVDSFIPTPAYINQHIALVRFDESKVNSRFVSYYLASYEPQKLFRASTDVGAKAGMSLLTVKKLKLVLPPLREQRAIAEALSDVDALIAVLDKLIAKKRDIKQATMQELLTGKTRLPGFSGEWEGKKLGEITSRYTNGGTPSTLVPEYWTGHIPWITGADVVGQRVTNVRRFITHDAVASSSTNVVDKGDLLVVSRTGVGKLAVAPFDIAISQDLTGVKLVKELALTEFVFRYFDYKRLLLTNLNQGTSIAGITRDTLSAVVITLPSIDEQRAIACFLFDVDAEITALELRRDKTRAVKQGMMQELLTGRIRI